MYHGYPFIALHKNHITYQNVSSRWFIWFESEFRKKNEHNENSENLFNASTWFAIQDTIHEQVGEGNTDDVFEIGIYNTEASIYEYELSIAIVSWT